MPQLNTVPAKLPATSTTARKPAKAVPAAPHYGWFSIVGMAGDLRAGVTDGHRVWFVREGDPLPGDVRIGRIAARPPGVQIEGGERQCIALQGQARRRLMTRQPVNTRPDTIAKTMVRPFARFFVRPGRRNGVAATEIPDANRLLRVPAMDARFRRLCAVFAGGRCLIARGYEADARLRSALLALRQSGAIPVAVAEETATLEEIAECWRAAGAASSPAAGEAAAGGSNACSRTQPRPGRATWCSRPAAAPVMCSPSSTTASCPWPNR